MIKEAYGSLVTPVQRAEAISYLQYPETMKLPNRETSILTKLSWPKDKSHAEMQQIEGAMQIIQAKDIVPEALYKYMQGLSLERNWLIAQPMRVEEFVAKRCMMYASEKAHNRVGVDNPCHVLDKDFPEARQWNILMA